MNANNEAVASITPVLHYKPVGAKMEVPVRMDLEGHTVWLTAPQMADLFRVTTQVITGHINMAYKQAKLDEEETRKSEFVAVNGIDKDLKLYNMDMVLLVGNILNPERCCLFRHWAEEGLKELFLAKERNSLKQEEPVKVKCDGPTFSVKVKFDDHELELHVPVYKAEAV